MITITQTEFRDHIKQYLDAVLDGEEVEICRHGKPIATVVPRQPKRTPSWKLGEPLDIPGVSLSKMIIEDRR